MKITANPGLVFGGLVSWILMIAILLAIIYTAHRLAKKKH